MVLGSELPLHSRTGGLWANPLSWDTRHPCSNLAPNLLKSSQILENVRQNQEAKGRGAHQG